MRRFLTSMLALAFLCLLVTGCTLVQPSADLTTDESEVRTHPFWPRGDQADNYLTPYRVYGAVGPEASIP